MGLDMYLSRKKYVGANYEHRQVRGAIYISTNGKELPIDFNKVSYIQEEVGYWRKANQIHKWFVDNVQDGEDNCEQHYVSLENLKELLEICKTVKEKAILKDGQIKNGMKMVDNEWVPNYEDGKFIENVDEIKKLLPTADGFLFGGTDYDSWYLENIENTIEILETIIKEEEALNKEGIYCDYYYESSW